MYAILSATAPLIQAWRARLGAPDDKREPYALYAASNLGSFAGLLAYPLLLEPALPISSQSWLWAGGYGVLVLLLGIGAVNAPPKAARKMPATNAPMYTRDTFTPMLDAISGL